MPKFKVGDRVQGNEHFFQGETFVQYGSGRIIKGYIGTVQSYQSDLVTVLWSASDQPVLWHESFLDLSENGLDVMLKVAFGD